MVERALKIKDTSATRKVFQLKKRIRAVAGGTGASKTISILLWCIDYAQSNKNELISVVSESYPHLEKGAMLDFEIIMKDRGYWNDKRWHGTKHQYTFETRTVLEFFSPDTYGKAHGPRRDVLFANECNNMEYSIVRQLMLRTRKVIWLDWNPSAEFWYYTELEGKREDLDFLHLTYLDNEAIDEGTLSEIMAMKNNKYLWTVYGLGLLGEVEGKIYKDWAIIDEIPHEAQLERYGLNFGYTNHPAAIVAIYRYNGGFILDEVAFGKGMSNQTLASIILNKDKALVIGDSAEPKSIDEISGYGVDIIGVSKKQGESKTDTFVKWSIALVQDQRISVTKRSLNVIKEYRNYLWMVDRNGKVLNEPEEPYHYSMDAIRYGIISIPKLIQPLSDEQKAARTFQTMMKRKQSLQNTKRLFV